MILNSIELENIRSYDNEKIQFPKGITLFEGDVGSGKSSILMSIEFALFGLGSLNGNALLNTNKEHCSVKLDFEANGESYQVHRKLKRKNGTVRQSSGVIIHNGNKETYAITEMKKKINQILQFNEPADTHSNSKIYRYSIYTPQDEMKNILLNTEKRLETIRYAFDIESYKTAIENTSLVINQLNILAEKYRERAKTLSELEREFFELRKIIASSQKQLTNLKNKDEENSKSKYSIEQKINHLKNNEKKLLQLTQQLNFLNTENLDKKDQYQNLKNELQTEEKDFLINSKKIKQLEKTIKPTNYTIYQLDKKIEKYRTLDNVNTSAILEVKNLKNEKIKLEKSLGVLSIKTLDELIKLRKKFQNEKENIQDEMSKLESLLQLKNSKKLNLNARTSFLQKNLQELIKVDSKCPVCAKIMDARHKNNLENERNDELKLIEEKLKLINSGINSLNVNIRKKKEEFKKIEYNNAELENKPTKLKELIKIKRTIQKFELQNLKLISQLQIKINNVTIKDPITYYIDLKGKIVQFQSSQNEIHSLKSFLNKSSSRIVKIKNNINDYEKRFLKLKKDKLSVLEKISSFKDLPKQLTTLNKSQANIEQLILEISNKKTAYETNLKNYKQRIIELDIKILESKKAKSEYDRCSNYSEWLKEFFIPTIGSIEKQVMLHLNHDFNQFYQNWCSMLIEDPLKETRIDEDFTPLIEQDGYLLPIEFLSGGEKTSIALAYRLALNTLMRQESESLKSNLLILDEPTDGFSKSQLDKVKNILKKLDADQIILVSHERELAGYVDNTYHISNETGHSHVNET